MKKIKSIIIDDEQHAVEVIEHFCKKIPYLEIVGQFTDPMEATEFIGLKKDRIDLVFLDMQMPRFSGMDFLKTYAFPNVILATAHSDYALPSYEYGVVDYLLKPFSFERFSLAVSKVYERTQKNVPRPAEEGIGAFVLKTERNKYTRINYSDILYVKGAKNYSVLKTITGDQLIPSRLKTLENQLPSDLFLRIHKSYIINLTHFHSLEGNILKLKNTESKLTVSPHYRPFLLSAFNIKKSQ